MEEFLNSSNQSTICCTAPGLFHKDLKLSFYKNSSSLLEKAITSTQKGRMFQNVKEKSCGIQ